MIDFIYRLTAAVTACIMFLTSLIGAVKQETEKEINNVIIMIGDGMGENHLEKTKQERGIELVMDTLPIKGYATTYCANKPVTDSAAASTAIACGVKTKKRMVGWYWFEQEGSAWTEGTHPKNITELCMENGMKTGIVTTDYTSGATPSGFSVHTDSRYNTEDILSQQLASGIDIIWGRDNKDLTVSEVEAAGYTYISTIDEMNSLTGNEKSYGLFTKSLRHVENENEYTPTLAEMTASAIKLLNTDNENGFFLMVEGAHIDKKAANTDGDGTTDAVWAFDNAVKVALDFAKEDGNTLLIVTADHETGGITLDENGNYSFTTDDHTDANVPVMVYGYYYFIEHGEVIDNTDISIRIAKILGFDEDSFPCSVPDNK